MTLAPVIEDVITKSKYSSYDTIITLQPTSPLRDATEIMGAHFMLKLSKNADSLISVNEVCHSLWEKENGQLVPLKYDKINRQNIVPAYKGNGAIFITKRDVLINKHDRLGDFIVDYTMPEWKSIDIHCREDLELAEYYAEKYLK